MVGELRFYERHTPTTGLFMAIKNHLACRRSRYQLIELFESFDFGRVLTLDRLVMLTERDEAAYHEMLVHVPMLVHPEPRRVLVVGGGDGGVLRELLRHPTLERAVQVEIDREVVDVCREHLRWAAAAYANPKVELVIGDALEYVKEASAEFDLVIVDSTDPIGPAVGLFQEPFYRDVHAALKGEGIVTCQLGSPFYSAPKIGRIMGLFHRIFPITALYLTGVPTYPSGTWALGIASKRYDVRSRPDEVRYNTIRDGLSYYNVKTHIGSFMLPEYLRQAVGERE